MVTNVGIPEVGNPFEEVYQNTENNSSLNSSKKSTLEVGNPVEEIYGSSTKEPTEVKVDETLTTDSLDKNEVWLDYSKKIYED